MGKRTNPTFLRQGHFLKSYPFQWQPQWGLHYYLGQSLWFKKIVEQMAEYYNFTLSDFRLRRGHETLWVKVHLKRLEKSKLEMQKGSRLTKRSKNLGRMLRKPLTQPIAIENNWEKTCQKFRSNLLYLIQTYTRVKKVKLWVSFHRESISLPKKREIPSDLKRNQRSPYFIPLYLILSHFYSGKMNASAFAKAFSQIFKTLKRRRKEYVRVLQLLPNMVKWVQSLERKRGNSLPQLAVKVKGRLRGKQRTKTWSFGKGTFFRQRFYSPADWAQVNVSTSFGSLGISVLVFPGFPFAIKKAKGKRGNYENKTR